LSTSIVKNTGKRPLMAKLMLSFRKHGSLNLLVMSESWPEAQKWQLPRMRSMYKFGHNTDKCLLIAEIALSGKTG